MDTARALLCIIDDHRLCSSMIHFVSTVSGMKHSLNGDYEYPHSCYNKNKNPYPIVHLVYHGNLWLSPSCSLYSLAAIMPFSGRKPRLVVSLLFMNKLY